MPMTGLAIPEIYDQPRGRCGGRDAKVRLGLEADRPAEDGLEVTGAHDLLDNRRAGARARDALRPLVDELALAAIQVEAGCGLHPHDDERVAGDVDGSAGAVLLQRRQHVLDPVPRQALVAELEHDAV